MEIEMSDFDSALDTFVNSIQTMITNHYEKNLPNLHVPTVGTDVGRRYVRVFTKDLNSRSAFCFVDRNTGDILKAAGWKVPAKHARGNIFSEDGGIGGVTVYGAKYL
jgi:hypothetical protein